MMGVPFTTSNVAATVKASENTTKTTIAGSTNAVAKPTKSTKDAGRRRVHPRIRRKRPIGGGVSTSILCVIIVSLALFQGTTIMQNYAKNTWLQSLGIRTGDEVSTVSLLKSKSNTIALVPIDSIFPCNGISEKVLCHYTLLIDNDTQYYSIPEPTTDTIVLTSVCEDLFRTGTKRLLAAPVCLQTPDTLHVLVYHDSWMLLDNDSSTVTINDSLNATTKALPIIRYVQKSHKISIIRFLKMIISSSTIKRIIKKKIDFPIFYKRINDITNTKIEPNLDNNYGNLVWRYGASRLLNSVTTEVEPSDRWNADVKIKDIHALVIAMANSIHLSNSTMYASSFNTKIDYIKARNVKTIVLGIGIQQNFDTDTIGTSSRKRKSKKRQQQQQSKQSTTENYYEIANRTDVKLVHEYQYRFLQEVSNRQQIPAIGVRGDFTRSVCINSGITNCITTGCPSLTISRDINLGLTLQNNWQKLQNTLSILGGDKNLRIAIGPPASEKGIVGRLAMRAVAIILSRYSHQTTVIVQSIGDQKRIEEYIRNVWKNVIPTSTLHTQKINFYQYTNVESWLQDAKTKYDLCISFRIHGSMPFINSGIPAIVIPTDYRIMELVAAMKLPHVVPEQLRHILRFNALLNTEQPGLPTILLNQANYTNFTEFEINRRNKIKIWTTIVNEAGLEIDPALTRILKSPL